MTVLTLVYMMVFSRLGMVLERVLSVEKQPLKYSGKVASQEQTSSESGICSQILL